MISCDIYCLQSSLSKPFTWKSDYVGLCSVLKWRDQKSVPDSVGICLIFSWHDKAQEQPNIKHITQPPASQSLSRHEKPVSDKKIKKNTVRTNKGVNELNSENITQSVCIREFNENTTTWTTCSTHRFQISTKERPCREGIRDPVRIWDHLSVCFGD